MTRKFKTMSQTNRHQRDYATVSETKL